MMGKHYTKKVSAKDFQIEKHYYKKALGKKIHSVVSEFLSLSTEQIIQRYCHIRPLVQSEKLLELLHHKPKYFHWAGADLFYVTTAMGKRQMLLIETNSCPSGQKSMPTSFNQNVTESGYYKLLKKTYYSRFQKQNPDDGVLAVIYDKNEMENSGYAAALSEIFHEPVYLVKFMQDETQPLVTFKDKKMWIQTKKSDWLPVRAVFRYVTQKPWNRLPIQSKTRIFNPIISCLAGGRNKLLAAKAYQKFNDEHKIQGLTIQTPRTIWDVELKDIPKYYDEFENSLVVKNPYSNAGQGVWTITSQSELGNFLAIKHRYDRFIVQSLVGHARWIQNLKSKRLFHVGTVPDDHDQVYAFDLRFMIASSDNGFYPVALYARRAKSPLIENLDEVHHSWDILGTNLSIKKPDGVWSTDTTRLITMAEDEFQKLGIGLDELVEGYVQTVMAAIAIDEMAKELIASDGSFKLAKLKELDDDETLLGEILL